MKNSVLLFILLPFLVFSQTQEYYAGIEIGGKGMKTTILQISNIKTSSYNVIESWSESTPISKNISKTDFISNEDMITTLNLLKKNFDKVKSIKNIDKNNIYIVVSSGVGIAKNTNDFLEKINVLLQVKSKVISVEDEVRLMILGGIPFYNIKDSFSIDIGGGNTKGGYLLDFKTKNDSTFSPIKLNYGTVSLTEKAKKNLTNPADFNEYVSEISKLSDSLNQTFKQAFGADSVLNKRKKIYFSGGTLWAFITLTQNQDKDEYKKFHANEVKMHQNDLLTNFEKFQNLALTNSEIKRVLDTYSKQYLVTGNIILLNFINNIDDIETKDLYFVSSGHLSWLKAYILESKKDTDKEIKNSKIINPKNIVSFRSTEF
ncbi:hypothetical protein FLBR109950_14060 [Flavobacterium branchiophilum]|uniref:Probable secreted exopolyphosphatase n=1 Tax=Flavobacterium branchiophilum (strain FL-15) TaxID=1034807 RepID=G2Z442_FLABF|nr:exopolyphosphatase [Flavobacterium branchiophilum]CCB68387.1 Probable secreted exopolyphosphatase precursor [Flavobacterium branchiophilum FL-15]